MATQSSGGRKRKEAPRKEINYKLHQVIRTLDPNVGLGRFTLEMLSGLKRCKLNINGCPSVFFDLEDDDQLEKFEIMKKLSHPNILEVYLIDQVEGQGCRVYLEHYVGVVADLLKNVNFSFINPKTFLVPSVPFKDILSDAIDGLVYLIEIDEYHGNFGWDTSFYCNNNTKRTLKLANFERRRSGSRLECQVADCRSLGYSLAEISERVKRLHPASSCVLLDDLSDTLISVTPGTFKAVMRDIKNHVFFWDERRTKTFYAVELPAAWDRAAFEVSFTQSPSVPNLPWTNQQYAGYLEAMKLYQSENNIDEYDGNIVKHFLRCISGMYTHQTELVIAKFTMTVHSAVQFAHPRLCLDLKLAVDRSNQPLVPA